MTSKIKRLLLAAFLSGTGFAVTLHGIDPRIDQEPIQAKRLWPK
ncbi:MAG: hypothetical protein ACK5Y2_09070 [Bdellovibrionales bacterium]